MKNYICTSEGFVKSAGFVVEKQEFVVEYTDKVRYAQTFNTQAATKFMERHELKGFIWKPYEQEAIRNMYEVVKNKHYDGRYFQEENPVEEWVIRKAIMRNESDVAFLTTKKMTQDNLMTFEEAKVEALRLNQEMFELLNEKLKDLINSTEP